MTLLKKDNNEKPTVALLFGGRGHEHGVSVMSAENLFSLIDRSLFDPLPVYIDSSGEWVVPKKRSKGEACRVTPLALAEGRCEKASVLPARIDGGSGLLLLEKKALLPRATGQGGYRGRLLPIAAAFPMLHGDSGEDGEVQGALTAAGIPFVGASVRAGALTSDKALTKLVAKSLGIPTSPWVVHAARDSAAESLARAEKEIGYPLFIKPLSLGSSVGASPAPSRKEAELALSAATELGGDVIIEKLIDIDRELECAYYSAECKELFTNIGDIRYCGGFYDYEAKYEASSATVNDAADISEELSGRIKELSKLMIGACGIDGLARVDFFLTKDGELLFNEINAIPGFTEGSLYPRLLARSGLDPKRAVTGLIRSAAARA